MRKKELNTLIKEVVKRVQEQVYSLQSIEFMFDDLLKKSRGNSPLFQDIDAICQKYHLSQPTPQRSFKHTNWDEWTDEELMGIQDELKTLYKKHQKEIASNPAASWSSNYAYLKL